MNFAQRALVLALSATVPTALLVAYDMNARADNSLGSPDRARARHPNQDAAPRTRIGLGETATFGTATDIAVVSSTDDGATRPQRVPIYSAVDFQCTTAGGWVCFSLTPNSDDIDISSTGRITDAATGVGLYTDPAPDGYGSCFFCSGQTSQVFELSHFQSATAVLSRTGECLDGSSAETGRPCRVDADCGTSYTCSTAANNLAAGDILYGYIITPASTNPINGAHIDVQGI